MGRCFSGGRMPLVVTGIAGLAAGLVAGCSAAGRTPLSPVSAVAASSRPAAAVDPITMMRDALSRCDALSGYTVVFHRQERRGLLSRLSDWERMQVAYRKSPSSIKAVWLNEDSEYAQAVYVEGSNDNKLTVLPRKGLFGLPASPASVDPGAAVQWGKSLRPITDFGLAPMLRRTLGHVQEAQAHGGAEVTYDGVVAMEKMGVQAHHIRVRYPQGFTRADRQDVYIDVETGYPVATYLWLPDGNELAAYLYEKPTLKVPADEVFAIDKSGAVAEK